jgi:DNA-3-methyladenine glycosylase
MSSHEISAALARPAAEVAPSLLGMQLVSDVSAQRVAIRITEVEAYQGADDPASHAFRGRTARTDVMFGPAGHLYCYFVYGMHWCANVVTGEPGDPGAVLVRAGVIVEGEQFARARNPAAVKAVKLASGPARLARALGLGAQHSGLDLLCDTAPVRLISATSNPGSYECGPRVGVSSAAEIAWRFWLPGEQSVSTYRLGTRAQRARPSSGRTQLTAQ